MSRTVLLYWNVTRLLQLFEFFHSFVDRPPILILSFMEQSQQISPASTAANRSEIEVASEFEHSRVKSGASTHEHGQSFDDDPIFETIPNFLRSFDHFFFLLRLFSYLILCSSVCVCLFPFFSW